MYKNKATGAWEHDFRVEGVPRYHISYGVIPKARAAELHAAVTALFHAKQLDVIEALRAGRVTAEQPMELRNTGQTFATAIEGAPAEEPWPEFSHAVEEYLTALANNPNKKPATVATARKELNGFVAFVARSLDADVRLDQVSTRLVSQFQTEYVASGMKQNTVTTSMTRIGALFRWFLRRELREAAEEKRPARQLHIPLDPETTSRGRSRRERFLSKPEAERLLAATPAPLLFPVASALFGGFRVQEMCHFRTDFDVDLDLGVLIVQRQPTWSPKTKRSVRNVPIADALRPMLEHHLERYSSDEWVTPRFSDPTEPVMYRTLIGHFERIVTDAEMVYGSKDPNGVTFHTLRHTFASWSLMEGTDVFTVSKLLGNSVQQVEDTYGHLAVDFRRAAVNRLSGLIKLPTIDTSDDSENSATTNATMEGEE